MKITRDFLGSQEYNSICKRCEYIAREGSIHEAENAAANR
jgi:hypothetical protein